MIVAERLRRHWRTARWWFVGSNCVCLPFAAFLGGGQFDSNNLLISWSFANALPAIAWTVGVVAVFVLLIWGLMRPRWRWSDKLWARAWIAHLQGDEERALDLEQQATDKDVMVRGFILGMLMTGR
ncbi:MAG TPA: hypothetical protein VMF62_12330 [Acetobacteraceae bacterium]|nr:hypothetical protein [Acetobacteraceae bacterium]